MANRTPEQDLIDIFVNHLQQHADEEICISKIINSNCKSKKFADIEFKSKANLHWVIEAKSNDSEDRYNTVHKIFGELLKGNADLFAQPRSFRDRAPLAIIARLPNEPPPCNRAFPTSSTPPRKS